MIYDAAGERLIRRDPGGATTLYLGAMELTLSGGAVTAKRYYAAGGAVVAMRTSTGLTWMLSGLHGSSQLAVNDATGQISRERYTPFGKRRGGDDLPFTDRGFLGKIEDAATGLTYLSARHYDPAIAKFISPDPVFNPLIPASLNPYAYAGDDPIGQSDSDGLCRPDYCPQRAGGLRRLADKAKTKAEKKKYEKLARKAEKDEAKRNWRQQKTHKESQRKANQEHFQRSRKRALDAAAKRRPEGFQSSIWCTLGTQEQCDAAKEIDLRLKRGGITPGESMLNGNMHSPLGLTKANRGGKGPVSGPCGSSFVPGTKVLMADSSSKPIEEIKIGDKVLATDPRTGKTEAKPVTALIGSAGKKRIVQVSVTADDGEPGKAGAVLATDRHPFWVEFERRWVDADQLKPGMWLRTGSGTFVQVSSVKVQLTKKQNVHNLTVADIATYYVFAGIAPVLVHNSGGPCPHVNYDGVPEHLRPAAENVIRSIDKDGTLPPGVRQGGTRKKPGTYGGEGLPPASENYYTEMDILPTPPGGKRADGRLVYGGRGEIWYTNHYKDGFVQLRGPHW